MGNIRTTEFAPTLPGAPQGPGEGEIIGQGIQQFAQAVGAASAQVGQAIVQRKNMAASKAAAETQQQLQEEWAETLRNADPDDDEVHTRFMNDIVKPRLEELKRDDRFLPQVDDHIERLNIGLTSQFSKLTFGDITELQSAQAGADFDSAVNSASTIVLNDPDAFDGQISLLEASVQAFTQSGGSSKAAIAMRAEGGRKLAMAAGKGAMNKSLEAGTALIQSGALAGILSGDQQAQLISYGRSREVSREAEARRISTENAALASGDYLEDMMVSGATQEQVDAMVDDPRFETAEGSAQLRILFNLHRSLSNEAVSGSKPRSRDNRVFDDILTRLQLERGDPSRPSVEEILSFTNRGLTMTDSNFLVKMEQGSGTVEGKIFNDATNRFLKFSKSTLVGSDFDPIANPAGEQAYNAFTLQAQQVIAKEREQGKTNEEIFGNDSTLMKMMPRFIVPRGTAIQSFRDRIAGEVTLADTPVLTGETAETAAGEDVSATVDEMDKFLRGE